MTIAGLAFHERTNHAQQTPDWNTCRHDRGGGTHGCGLIGPDAQRANADIGAVVDMGVASFDSDVVHIRER